MSDTLLTPDECLHWVAHLWAMRGWITGDDDQCVEAWMKNQPRQWSAEMERMLRRLVRAYLGEEMVP